jgi:ABC-2 type transport system permease protein
MSSPSTTNPAATVPSTPSVAKITGAASRTLQPIPGSTVSRFLSDGGVTTWRNLMKIIRVPEILLFSLIQPVMFVLLFSYVFGAAIDIPGDGYTSFLMAGIFAQTVVFGSTYSGSAMAQDLKDGIIDRFRTLPMSGAAVLVGRTNGDLVINALSMVVMMITGYIVGWRVNSSPLEFLAAVGLLLLFAYSFSWVMAFIGMAVKSPEIINNASFLILFPLTFISNAFVPSESLPGPLRTFAEWNPVSALVQSARELFGNVPPGTPVGDAWTAQNPIATVLIGVSLLLLVFVPLSIRKFATFSR